MPSSRTSRILILMWFLTTILVLYSNFILSDLLPTTTSSQTEYQDAPNPNTNVNAIVEKTSSSSNNINNIKDRMTENDPFTIAYAVSFIKCGDFQTNAAGLVDASLILRHSIHKISKRNPLSGSKYDYKMYAIVHRQAEECSKTLKDVGFEIVVVDSPIQNSEIRGDHVRKHIHKAWCCGSDEFIKWYAYTLPHEVIVHVDIDVAFYKPMDNLFDAILFDKDSEEGKAARGKLELENPHEDKDKLPDKIGAFITKDWGQVAPRKFPAGYQAGFLVARHDPKILPELREIVLEGNYTDGWGYGRGWGNSGHGGYVGAMAMQGLIAYYYDHVNKDNAVELNQCRYNHMGMKMTYENNPNWNPRFVKKELIGGCRNAKDYCEDCMVTDFDKIYGVHYTMCRKPWQCVARGDTGSKTDLPLNIINQDHCYELVRHWHDLRVDFEQKLHSLTGDETIWEGSNHDYREDIFRGHCKEEGNSGYVTISAKKETMERVSEIYL